jgi:hypothetical protein
MAHNRSVYALPPYGGSGYGFARSATPFPRKTSATFWPPCKRKGGGKNGIVCLCVCLYGRPKRRLQSERYVP